MPIPTDFAARKLRLKFVDASELIRIFRTPRGTHPAPIYYGSAAKFRFDCPASANSTFGVMYAAYDLPTCFAETITREENRNPLKRGGISVSISSQISPRFVTTLQASSPLRLADMTDVGLYGLGAEAGEFNSIEYDVSTQPWALGLFNRQEGVDGLIYRSRFLNGRCAVAIFDRGGLNVSLAPAHVMPLAAHPDYMRTLAELDVCLIP